MIDKMIDNVIRHRLGKILGHGLRMLWLLVRFRKPWIFYDSWKGVLAKGPGGVPETDPFLYFRVPRKLSGLPVDLLVPDGDGYLDTAAPLLVLFDNGYGTFDFKRLVPMSVSLCPRVRVKHFEKGITERDYQKVRSFVRRHRGALRELAGGTQSPEKTLHFIDRLRQDLR